MTTSSGPLSVGRVYVWRCGPPWAAPG